MFSCSFICFFVFIFILQFIPFNFLVKWHTIHSTNKCSCSFSGCNYDFRQKKTAHRTTEIVISIRTNSEYTKWYDFNFNTWINSIWNLFCSHDRFSICKNTEMLLKHRLARNQRRQHERMLAFSFSAGSICIWCTASFKQTERGMASFECEIIFALFYGFWLQSLQHFNVMLKMFILLLKLQWWVRIASHWKF